MTKLEKTDSLSFVIEAAVSVRRGLLGHRITAQCGLTMLIYADAEKHPGVFLKDCFVPEVGETINYHRVYLTPHTNA